MKNKRRLVGGSIGILAGLLFVLIVGYRAWNDRDQVWVFRSEVDPLASPTAPILCKNGNLLKGALGHPLYALDSVSGRVRWKFVCPIPGEAFTTHPVADSDDTVYIGSETKLYALDGATGKERWSLSMRQSCLLRRKVYNRQRRNPFLGPAFDEEKSMVTITLPPELERVVTERAKQQGTTPELWTLDRLTQSLQAEEAVEPASEDGSMLDFFEGYIGVLDSSEFVPGGAQMSLDTGHKFAEGMLKKRQEGKL